LNLWGSILRETFADAFQIVFVDSQGGEYINGGISQLPTTISQVIIYAKKYSNALSVGASNNKPYHKAFINASGQIKIVDPDIAGIDDKYKSANKNQAIPSLDEAEWIAAGIAGLDKPASELSSTGYAGLPSAYKWTDATDFNANAVSAAPSDAPAHLAAGGAGPSPLCLSRVEKTRPPLSPPRPPPCI
jgi:hypothetical protein